MSVQDRAWHVRCGIAAARNDLVQAISQLCNAQEHADLGQPINGAVPIGDDVIPTLRALAAKLEIRCEAWDTISRSVRG